MWYWVNYIRNEAGDDLIWRPTQRQFGDWLAYSTTRSDYPGATTDKDLSATAYFFHSVNLMGNIATVLGYKEEAIEYQNLKDRIKKAFNDEFVTPNGRLSSNTQTAYVLALSFDLLPDDIQTIAASRLADDVNAFGHITTGFLGTAAICHVLTEYGYIDEAYKLIYREEYPSWLYPLTKGATTIWERWDGIKPNGDLQDPGMNSFNHFAYGAVGNWLYQVVAGINPDPDFPGFRKIIIKPFPGGEMNHVAAHHDSPYGRISSTWNVSEGIMQLEVTIPSNTSACIYIPSTDYNLNLHGMKEVEWVPVYHPGLKYHFLKTQVGSGKYTFRTAFSFKE
jgi:alpha-L-rhamnosidase